jgi:hypothetical protein
MQRQDVVLKVLSRKVKKHYWKMFIEVCDFPKIKKSKPSEYYLEVLEKFVPKIIIQTKIYSRLGLLNVGQEYESIDFKRQLIIFFGEVLYFKEF